MYEGLCLLNNVCFAISFLETRPTKLVKILPKIDRNVITPTTKAEDHDEPISPKEIVSRGLMTQADWDKVSAYALALFNFGQQEAAKRGLLLVDTKYEFGKDKDGNIFLIDEIHTPDSSRYWLAGSYPERHAAGKVSFNFRNFHNSPHTSGHL